MSCGIGDTHARTKRLSGSRVMVVVKTSFLASRRRGEREKEEEEEGKTFIRLVHQ